MSISKKITDEITNLNVHSEFKKLLLELLKIEDKGNHKNNQLFEKEIKEYIKKTGGAE
ncbi:hypothetical protein [Absiella sp. AM29-15]|uniref:hypothetical protein n=1 Tax=Absiella sp. AM29-15 TaxID=2292278 RepID=UPI0013144D4F|nr:hypothetical protein [Absiella sp. AM29-15]